MPSERHRFVIVGAGLAGAATAWHLRQRGVADVLLLEKESMPGTHSSGRNAAILREDMEEPALQPLARASAAVLRAGRLGAFSPCGGLLVGLGDEDVSRWIPWARGRARFTPGDGVLDVAGLLQGFLRGAAVRTSCELLSFAEGPDRTLRLETNQGPLLADVLVNAAGPWAGQVGALPLEPRNRHLFVSATDPTIQRDAPFLWDPGGGYYLRPESGGLLMSPCDETPAAPGAYAGEPAALEDLLAKLARHQPGLPEPRIAHHWVGQRTFAGDRLPVIGFDPRRRGLFHVAALGGHGVTLSHAVGALAAGRLLAGPGDDGPFAAARLLDR